MRARVLVLAAALAGCGVKAAPRPPLRASPAPGERPAAAASAPAAECRTCPAPDPSLAATARAP